MISVNKPYLDDNITILVMNADCYKWTHMTSENVA